MRRWRFECSSFLVLATVALGCGGGGGGEAPPAPPPCEAVGKVCYVSTQGSNTNTGATPQQALRTIAKAAEIALSDYAIIVAPGTYPGEVTTAVVGRTPQRLRFVAQGTVVVDVRGIRGAAGFTLASSTGSVIDGFTIVGGADGGIVIKSRSDGLQIRNCTITGSDGDGIRIQDSPAVLIFDNLIHSNAGIGVRVAGSSSGSANAMIVNNTIYGNGARGLEIGNTSAASPGAYVYNNIIEANGSRTVPALENIKVETNPRSDLGFQGDNNLVFPATYVPGGAGSIRGAHDVNADAQFLAPTADFHLASSSPAINRGDPLEANMAELRTILTNRTTTGVDRDFPPLDIGYHYPR